MPCYSTPFSSLSLQDRWYCILITAHFHFHNSATVDLTASTQLNLDLFKKTYIYCLLRQISLCRASHYRYFRRLDSVTLNLACAIRSFSPSMSNTTCADCSIGSPITAVSWLGNTGSTHYPGRASWTSSCGMTSVSMGALIAMASLLNRNTMALLAVSFWQSMSPGRLVPRKSCPTPWRASVARRLVRGSREPRYPSGSREDRLEVRGPWWLLLPGVRRC